MADGARTTSGVIIDLAVDQINQIERSGEDIFGSSGTNDRTQPAP
jgi:hypothetical protein